MRKKHLSKRILCFSLVGLLLVGNVQTVLAKDEAPAKQTGVTWIDDDVKDNLNVAEAKAKETEEAKIKAEEAAAAVEQVEEAVYGTDVVSDNTVDELITKAEDEVEDVTESGNSIDQAVAISVSANEYISANEAAITTSANEAVVEINKDTVSANEAAADASTAEEKAAKALEAAKAAKNGTDAQAAADLAKAAYVEAKAASDEAASFYKNAVAKLDAAQKALDDALLMVSENVADYEEALATAVANAEAALTEAKNAVELARAEYNKAVDNTINVADKAAEALKLSGKADAAAAMVADASKIIDTEVKVPVDADIALAKKDLAAKQETEKKAKELFDATVSSQNKVIADATKKLSYDDAMKRIDNLTRGLMSDLDVAKFRLDNSWMYSDKKLKEARKVVNQYNEAVAVRDAVNKANSKIEVAQNGFNTAAADSLVAQTKLSDLQLYLATFNYVNEGESISYSDVTTEEQNLLKEMLGSSKMYNEITNDVNYYDWATADKNLKDIVRGIFNGTTFEKMVTEKSIELKYYGWTNYDGTFILIKNDKENKEVLVKIQDYKASILEKDQGEFACYAAAYDKVASAQAAANALAASNAAQAAAQKVADAEARLAAAEKALAEAKAKLETAKINKLNVELAKAELAKAESAVGVASEEVELAKVDETTANAEYLAAQKIADSFKVTTDSNNSTTTDTQTAKKVTVISDNQTALAAAPVAQVSPAPARNTGNTRQATRTTTEIADEEVAQAPTVDEATEEVVADDADETTVIADEDTAKAATMDEKTFAWWWILVVIAAAVAGFVGYRYNKVKKAVKPVTTTKTEK